MNNGWRVLRMEFLTYKTVVKRHRGGLTPFSWSKTRWWGNVSYFNENQFMVILAKLPLCRQQRTMQGYLAPWKLSKYDTKLIYSQSVQICVAVEWVSSSRVLCLMERRLRGCRVLVCFFPELGASTSSGQRVNGDCPFQESAGVRYRSPPGFSQGVVLHVIIALYLG